MPLALTRRNDSSVWWITGRIRGERIRESTRTADRALAEELRAAREWQLLHQAMTGTASRRTTFAEVVLSYIQHGGPHSAPTRARVLRLLDHFGQTIAADDVDQVALDNACIKLLRLDPAPATRLREIISPARAILTHGATRRMCAAPMLRGGKASPGRTEWMTPKDAERLIAGAAPHLAALIQFLIATGARLSEALALVWADVDLTYGQAVLRDTKNGRDRTVILCPRAVAAIGSITGAVRNRRIGGGHYPRATTGPVFRTSRGEPYAAKEAQGGGQVKTAWKAAMKRAGLSRPFTPHCCRHTWASWHYAVHKDLLLLKAEGDWSSVSLVERYAHLTPAGMAREIEAWRGLGTIRLPASAEAEIVPMKANR